MPSPDSLSTSWPTAGRGTPALRQARLGAGSPASLLQYSLRSVATWTGLVRRRICCPASL